MMLGNEMKLELGTEMKLELGTEIFRNRRAPTWGCPYIARRHPATGAVCNRRFVMRNPDIKEMLSKYKNIAVVGLSPDAGKPSHEVAAYLKKAGFRIIPVNPACKEEIL